MIPRLQVTISPRGMLLVFDKKQLKKTMRAAGNEVAAVARRMISAKGSGGRLYYGPGGTAGKYRGGYVKGRYRASAAGQPPALITGTLKKSIRVRPFKSGEGVAVRTNKFYALFLEDGAKGGGRKGARPVGPPVFRHGKRVRGGRAGTKTGRVLEPRPFLTAALTQREASLSARIEAAVLQDVAFKRIKP